jgi:hypothetical protein
MIEKCIRSLAYRILVRPTNTSYRDFKLEQDGNARCQQADTVRTAVVIPNIAWDYLSSMTFAKREFI